MNIPTPYLVFLGDAKDYKQAKTAFGLKEWRPELCVGQMRIEGCEVDLGLPDLTCAQARERGAKTFLIGISPFTTTLPDAYVASIINAIQHGFDIANPLHDPLPELIRNVANMHGVQIYNFRHRDVKYPKATGEKRSGIRLLTVGTDCACGKKFTALSISKALSDRNIANTFRSTGQTGFLISQSGINNDTIQADFLSGAAEWLTPDADPCHIDVVEGQGALSHPSFGAGALSLLYGTQPDFLVMCHEPGRKTQRGVSALLPDIREEIYNVERMARRTNPRAAVIGVSLFTQYASEKDLESCLDYASSLCMPVFDPASPKCSLYGGFDALIHLLSCAVKLRGFQRMSPMDKHGAKYV